jgi:hypothetical protein
MAIELKLSYLKAHTTSKLVDRLFSRYYWDLGVAAYPKFKAISDMAIKKAEKSGYNGPKYVSGKFSIFLSKLLGWRLVRILSYVRHGI